MEPPAKRMRILQSVEVDDTNPDYINAKQKQQQKFKGRLESIFAKYENMHASMSDEIDMRENKVVVDRGHLRRLVRQVNRKETILLDNLGIAAEGELEGGLEQEEGEEDSEDELAPTQPSNSSSRESKKEQSATSATKGAHSPEPKIIDSMTLTSSNSLPITPHPAANLFPLVQFPQTPAGQQAQSSFYATLAQTINQAVQQAVAPLFSSILPKTPSSQQPFLNPLAHPTTPVINSDKVAPATDPKWFFPPLSDELENPGATQSSPIPVAHAQFSRPKAIEAAIVDQPEGGESQHTEMVNDALQQNTVPVAALITSVERVEIKSIKGRCRKSPRVEIQRKSIGRASKHQFSEEDDIYISKQKMLYGRSWAEIKGSKEEWEKWPMIAFHNRWSQQLKGKKLHLKDTSPWQKTRSDSQTSEADIAASTSHHLPTPSSLDHDESSTMAADATEDVAENIISSSAHFDDDERELLSLAGTDLDEERSVVGIEEDETFFPHADEVILPSVELPGFVDEDMLQQGLLEDSPTDENPDAIETLTTVRIKKESMLSPSTKRKWKQDTILYETMAKSDTEADDVENDGCNIGFQNEEDMQEHRLNSQSSHERPRTRSASIDLIGHDELQAPMESTAHIKREFSTPPPTSFLFSTPAPQLRSDALPSSSSLGSASRLGRKAYLKQVKQSWTKKSTMTPKESSKMGNIRIIPRKRAWVDDEESGDELAM
ncbi:hypothetical protein GQ44DRAFT_696672 [Phaeosphaeriaceae sp. PMI808]|nr:hypothetical protein GQ44DRAFT_696672 [Phaeosphaeriaceae sp. PMI808]